MTAFPAGVEHQVGGHDAADDDALVVRVLEGVQDVAREGEDVGDGSRPAGDGLGEALAVHPVPGAPREVAAEPGAVDAAEAGVVELGEDLPLAQEPGAAGAELVEVDAEGDAALEDEVAGDVQDALVRLGDEALEVEEVIEEDGEIHRDGKLHGEDDYREARRLVARAGRGRARRLGRLAALARRLASRATGPPLAGRRPPLPRHADCAPSPAH